MQSSIKFVKRLVDHYLGSTKIETPVQTYWDLLDALVYEEHKALGKKLNA